MSNVIQIVSSLFELDTARKINSTVVAEPQEASDELSVLIRQCIAQKASAQKKLYDKYAPAAYGVIKRYLYKKDESAAVEILNDAFMKIFTNLHKYGFKGAFEGWVRKIVINTITDHLRKNLKPDRYQVEIQPETVYVQEKGLDNIAYKELLECVQSLPETARIVFNLFVFENYAHKEIAEMLGISENNSRWHLNDARNRLKEKILLSKKK
jgi:RNA polymerase sigma-70 factor, ECF subfamily